jgi:hypothetical protein
MPSACDVNGASASHNARRGEYAVAPNCTMTNVNEKTMADNVIVPDAMVE